MWITFNLTKFSLNLTPNSNYQLNKCRVAKIKEIVGNLTITSELISLQSPLKQILRRAFSP